MRRTSLLRALFLSLILSLFLAACDKDSPPPEGPAAAATNPGCVVELSADKSEYFETAQRLGTDFFKLARLPFSAKLENEVRRVVADRFQTIHESNVRCMIVAKLQVCAMNARNEQLASRLQETVDKTCAGGAPPATPALPGPLAGERPAPPTRTDLWACIPPGRRGTGGDFENQDPTRSQLGGGVLHWSSKPTSDAIRCVELLAAAGADLNYTEAEPEYQGYFGGPPLHLALSHRRWDMAQALLRLGADPGRHSLWREQTAAEVAQGWGAPDSVLALLQRTPD